jgi:hypothetical protein
MRRTLILALLTLSLAGFTACGGDDDDPAPDATTTATERPDDADHGDDAGDLSEREDELRATVPAAVKALFTAGGIEAYGFTDSTFRENCSIEEFIAVMALARIFLGELDPEDVTVEVRDIEFDDDRAYVSLTASLDGNDLSQDQTEDSFGDYWVYEDGGWKFGTDDDEPCDASFGDDDDEDRTPVSGPGRTREEALPVGETVETAGLRVTVLDIDNDADATLADLDEFPATPVPGARSVLIRLRVEYVGDSGDDTVQVWENDYKLTGSNNVVYDSFGDASCGFLPDRIDAELFPGGEIEGYVCFRVPEDETDLILVVDPFASFDDDDRRFLRLE